MAETTNGTRVGFVGLGGMGSAMLGRLLAAGHAPAVWNRTPEKAITWAEDGALPRSTPAEVAAESDVVCICVTDTDAVEAVVFGPDGIAAGARPGSVLVDHSTIHPVRTRELAARLEAEAGMHWVDVPVSGGVAGADAGTLVMMAGGDAADLERVRPVMSAYGARVTHMGPVGAGQATKIANQMIIGGNVAVAAEAMNYVANFGVSAAMLPDALAGGWADSAVLQNHARRMAAADYANEVDARIMAKDVDIACELGRETGSPMPVTALVQQLYRLLIANGEHARGQSGIMWLYRQKPVP